MKKINKNSPMYNKYYNHKKLYRIIEGSVIDAFNSHPDYLTESGKRNAVNSITKRVMGSILANPEKVHSTVSSTQSNGD